MTSGPRKRIATPAPEPAPALPVRLAPPDEAPVDDAVQAAADLMDRAFRAGIARATGGLSPAAISAATLDWAAHLSHAPGKQAWLAWKGLRKALRLAGYAAQSAADPATPPCIEPLPGDRRFENEAWQTFPFNIYQQQFLSWQQWLHNATTEVRGVSKQNERIVAFIARQMLDLAAPSNFLATNPVVLQRTLAEGGANLLRGFTHFLEDAAAAAAEAGRARHQRPNQAVGTSVAITPGKIVYRNSLIELIQYAPTTETVAPEPVLIVPAWIMKYYILDLSARNSLVRFLCAQGFTVFMISWHNPTEADRDLGMEDYHRQGVMDAIDAALAIACAPRLHAAGYCLGGTLLSIAAAAMARDSDNRLASLTLFAAQQDFTEAGELTLFINDSQVALLEDMMWEKGYLDARQMAGAFQILHANDLIWSHVIESYLLGERANETDLMAWNADTTRMPARMHAEYLRGLFLDNDLAEGRWRVGGNQVAINDIHTPIFMVGTETDHVAPWRSAHKIHLLTDAEITFILTTGGHNAGIVSEPGHRGRSYRMLTRPQEGRYIPPDTWLDVAPRIEGSWWPAWTSWLAARSGQPVPPPPLGNPQAGCKPLCDAPGTYVLEG